MNNLNKFYKLYKDGKTLDEIAEITHTPKHVVQQNIIDSKLAFSIVNDSFSILDDLLSSNKQERLDFISNITQNEKSQLIEEISEYITRNKSNSDDHMIVIWLIGELKLDMFGDELKKQSLSKNGNLKRMAVSAMGKILDEDYIDYIKQACKDSSPQVRAYAIKAFYKYDVPDKIEFMRVIYKNETAPYNRRTILNLVKDGN